jgi:hypothetical protein
MATGERPGRTATFTHTFRLEVDDRQAQVLGTRFDAATRLYNDVLAECFRRARRMRESRLGHVSSIGVKAHRGSSQLGAAC